MKRSQRAVVTLLLLVSLIIAISLLIGIDIPLLLKQWFPFLSDPWTLLAYSWVFFGVSVLAALIFLEKLTSLAASLFKVFSGIWFYAEKKAVSLRIEDTLSLTAKKVNNESVELLPHGIRIRWVEPKDSDAFLKDGKIVVCLEPSRNEDRNLARATARFVSCDLIRESQRFVDPTIMESAVLALTRKMLLMDKRIDALKCLGQERISPAVEKNPEIGTHISAMELMDTQGYFTRVLLMEFSYLGARLGPKVSDPKAVADTIAFVRLLKDIVEKEPEEDVPLDHFGEVIRAKLLPVARLDASFSTSAFQKRVVEAHNKDIDTIYVLARGWNKKLAKLVVKQAVESGLYQERQRWSFKVKHKGKKVKSYVAVLARANP